jgi:hypothetical protein
MQFQLDVLVLYIAGLYRILFFCMLNDFWNDVSRREFFIQTYFRLECCVVNSEHFIVITQGL